jgi:hypothetical protein
VSGEPIPERLRTATWQRANGRCEYCLFHDDDALLPHHADHIVARQHRGGTTLENLALACCECNGFKGPNPGSFDPVTGELVRLFNPRQDHWAEHFRLESGIIVGLTPIGRATALLLQFNDPERVLQRQQLQRARRYPR